MDLLAKEYNLSEQGFGQFIEEVAYFLLIRDIINSVGFALDIDEAGFDQHRHMMRDGCCRNIDEGRDLLSVARRLGKELKYLVLTVVSNRTQSAADLVINRRNVGNFAQRLKENADVKKICDAGRFAYKLF